MHMGGNLLLLKSLVKDSIEMIEDCARCSPNGSQTIVAFSGGKDSIVLLDLVRRAQIKHRVVYNVTTLDPPELVRHIKKYYPDTEFSRPPFTPEQLVRKKRFLPTRRSRYCCDYLKEQKSPPDSTTFLGVRKEESATRRGRQPIVVNTRGRLEVHPILEWASDEIWAYIEDRGLPYCSLYDEGWKRLGCVGCPIISKKKRATELARWPHIEMRWRKMADISFPLLYERHKAGIYRGKWKDEWVDGESLFEWWMSI